MSKRNVFGIIIVFLAFFGVFWVASSVVATEGGGQSDEEFSGCNLNDAWSIDTCVGAEWRYYETNSNSVVIKGKGNYAPGTTITGCGGVGGYWRYAMVAYKRSQYSDGTWYNPGDQVGVTGMSGNSDSVFDSVYWNKDKDSYHLGAMYYYCPNCSAEERTNKMNRDFARIKTEYEAAQRQWPNIFTKGFNKNSDLAWFCAENPNAAEYSSESKVSNSTTNNYTNNSYTTSSIKKASDSNRTAQKSSTVNVGGTIYITFAHNVYANKKVTKNVKWKVTKSLKVDSSGDNTVGFYYKKPGVYNDSRFTISAPAKNPSSGKKYARNGMAPTVEENTTIAKGSGTTPGFMADGGYRDSSNSSSYVFRDYYRIKFVEAGTYEFCETISVDGTAITTACSKITVSDVSVDTDCTAWIPNTYGLHKNGHVYLNLMGGTSSIVSKVKNSTTNNNTWADAVYAKPGDRVQWIHCYYPGAQMAAGMDVVDLEKKSGGTGGHGAHKLSEGVSTWNAYANYSTLWNNTLTSGRKAWTNQLNIQFSSNIGTDHVYGGNGVTSGVTNNNYPIDGSYDSYKIRRITDKPFGKNQVSSAQVGETYEEWGETGFPVTSKVTNEGRECSPLSSNTCQHLNDYLYGNLSGNGVSSAHAKLLVPYNFKNKPVITLGNVKFYAGESTNASASGQINVETRYNETTVGEYATKVKGASIRAVGFVSDTDLSSSEVREITGDRDIAGDAFCRALGNPTGCARIDNFDDKETLDLNTGGNPNGASHDLETNSGIVAHVPDVSAGKYYCVALAVYPAKSGVDGKGGDTTMDIEGSRTWAVSAPGCKKIAKRPSIQVWGAGLYTANDLYLERSLARKWNVNVNDLNLGEGETVAFGPWVEQNIIALGNVSGLASGASVGMPGATNRTKNGLGGSLLKESDSFCILSPLTMPNSDCGSKNNSDYDGGSPSGSAPSAEKQEDLIKPYLEKTEGDMYKTNALAYNKDVSLPEDGPRDGKTLEGRVCEFPALDYSTLFNEKKTQIYTCMGEDGGDGTIVISNDIEYPDGGYSSFDEVPKIIIYAKKNIWISCNVNRIDAVLIAEGIVDDCYESFSEWVNDSIRSRQLTIYGSIIANRMTARRTFGGATGKNSSVPAEIVNYDSSLYLWSFSSSKEKSSKDFKVTYQVELPPRL